MRHFLAFSLILSLLVTFELAQAYPEFIGYKYASCMTCHYNGHGGGALNDYGRALWATEFAARPFTKGQTDDEIAASSGVLGKTQLPWWIRPGLKVRELAYQTNPGSTAAKTRTILMQADANIAVLFDENQKIIFVGSYGYAPVPQRFQTSPTAKKPKEWISREHYIRLQLNDNWYSYVGMLDKPYGIRTVNHTAYSRARTGLAQNDQSHGLLFQYVGEKWENSFNVFAGNLFQEKDLRQKGASATFDYALDPLFHVGFSALSSTNDYLALTRAGFQLRAGQGNGSSILMDAGLISDKPKNASGKNGYYIYTQATQKIIQGYHLFTVAQAYKEDMVITKADYVKFGFGLLAFPMMKTEFRVEAESTREVSTGEVQPDAWALSAQLHLAL